MNINQYAVYQLKESAELAAYRSRSYQYLTEHHFQVIVQNYQQAYFTKLFTFLLHFGTILTSYPAGKTALFNILYQEVPSHDRY